MKLLVYKSNQLVKEITLKSGTLYTVGRKESCHIVLEKLPGISREHFEIDEDGAGNWRVKVLSEVMPIEVDGTETDEFTLKGKGEFYLKPYRFAYAGEAKVSNSFNELAESETSSSFDASDEAPQNLAPLNNFDQNTPSQPMASEEDDNFAGSDEKTSIHSFSGHPYVKIIGQNGKRSEYFRLEGNLWTVGGHESASVFIDEPSASQNQFEISKTEKGFFIVDSGTGQGTELNGQKLTPKKPTRLLSGDIISVGETSMQFELRDKAFKRKVSNIPLNMYKNPLVFFDQEVAMVSVEDEELSDGEAEEVSQNIFDNKEKKKRFFLIAAVVLVFGMVAAQEFMNSANQDENKKVGADAFSQLSPAEQKIVMQTYKLAKQLYLNRNFELALGQLEKLHSIIPVYKDSQEMEEYCINSRDLLRQQAEIEQQRKAEEQLHQQVLSLLSQCNQQYANSDDIDGVKACLAPAADLDPNNPGIATLITEVTARAEEKKIRAKIAREQADKIRRGKELFEKAQQLHKRHQWIEAMHAYENHIHSGLPDPKKLVKKSKRKLATIEKKIKSDKTRLMGEAQQKYSGSSLRDAIILARKAQRVDPYDPQISSFLFKTEKELKNRMKAIYMDSVLEERFGNLEASRVKWEEILKKDVENGEYYRKATRKLKQYEFRY